MELVTNFISLRKKIFMVELPDDLHLFFVELLMLLNELSCLLSLGEREKETHPPHPGADHRTCIVSLNSYLGVVMLMNYPVPTNAKEVCLRFTFYPIPGFPTLLSPSAFIYHQRFSCDPPYTSPFDCNA